MTIHRAALALACIACWVTSVMTEQPQYVVADRIAAVGPLTSASAKKTIDATGLALAPGFIDVHSHAGGWLASEGSNTGNQCSRRGSPPSWSTRTAGLVQHVGT